ncbi:hypothetical protein ARMGADRAFT_1090134 [Armillaria gallica]|uniref:Uncharacterized protein n=1 Tax=Armillaria gallica TaxID=47427 RepID=A0A2H3D5D6_ARMGA|nr:hypothetical protein ARMGADRAFT_1090134 [Armillaria gallica]
MTVETIRIRTVHFFSEKNLLFTSASYLISSTGGKWTVSVRNGGDAKIGWHDRRKYLQVCTSYHKGGKDGSSIHDVAAAPYKLQEHRCISEIDTLSQGVDDAINLWEAGFDS